MKHLTPALHGLNGAALDRRTSRLRIIEGSSKKDETLSPKTVNPKNRYRSMPSRRSNTISDSDHAVLCLAPRNSDPLFEEVVECLLLSSEVIRVQVVSGYTKLVVPASGLPHLERTPRTGERKKIV